MPDPKLTSHPGADEESLGTVHEKLEGWIPSMASDKEIRQALEKAFDYRGDITITLRNGERVEGYVFDRRSQAPSLSECTVRVMPKNQSGRITLRYSDIAGLAFTGRDSAAGKSFEAWVKKYKEKISAGEKNIGIDAEPLD